MATSKLAEMYVLLTVRGQQALESTLGRVQRTVSNLHGVMQNMGRVAGKAFLTLQGGLLGFIYAGTRGTAVGAQFSHTMEMLSREIASVFLPAILRVLNALRSLVDWFRSLDGAQQDQVQKWALLTVGALGFAAVLPKLVTAGAAVVGVLGATGIALAAIPLLLAAAAAAVYDLATAWDSARASQENWLNLTKRGIQLSHFGPLPAVKIAEWVTGQKAPDELQLGGSTRAVAGRLGQNLGLPGLIGDLRKLLQGGTGQGRRDLAFGQPGFEAPTETFKRVSVAAGMGGLPAIDKQQLDELKTLREVLERVEKWLGSSQPVVTGGVFAP